MAVKLFKLGNWYGLPEFGITEFFGGEKGSLNSPVVSWSPSVGISTAYESPQIFENTKAVPSNSNSVFTPSNTSNKTSTPSNTSNKTSTPSNTSNKTSTPSNKTTTSSDGYSVSEIFRKYGLNPADKSKIYKRYGVDNALDLERAILRERSSTSGIEKLIQDRYNSYLDYINRAREEIPTLRQTDLGYLQGQRQNMLSSLERARDIASQNIEAQRQQGIRELAEQFRSGANAANMLIGAAGGGNSSAVPMASYALQKQANKGANALMREKMARQAEIDNTYQTELANLNEWYNTNEKSIIDYYNQYLQRLEEMKLGAGDVKYEALSNLQSYIVEKAQSELEKIRNEALERSKQLQNWALKRAAEINNANQTLSKVSYDPYETISNEISFATNIGYSPEDYGYNPYVLRRKRAGSNL